MQIFKTYFKIIKKHMGQILIYIGVFIALSIVVSLTSSPSKASDFTQTKTRVVFINEDENSVLIEGFKDYLGKSSIYIDIKNDTQKLQDALFFRDAEYIAKIPKGFTESIMSGKEMQLNKTAVADSSNGIYTDILVNKYFNTVRLYISNQKDISQKDLVSKVAKDLSKEAKVQIKREEGNSDSTDGIEYYFNYLAYILISILILGVTSTMMVFNNKNIRRRNLCSPLKNSSQNIQILLGNIVFALICWGLMIVSSILMTGGEVVTQNGVLFCINSFVFTIMTLCMSFLVGIFVKNSNAQSGVTNVLALGLSFISGVFVPQELLGKSVLEVAKFTPTYWYVKANAAIANLSSYKMENLIQIFQYMLIELAFAVALLSVALLMSKRKQMGEN